MPRSLDQVDDGEDHDPHHVDEVPVQADRLDRFSPFDAEVARLRRAIEGQVQEVLEAGVASGDFDVDDVRGTARAILSLSIDLLRWFSPDGPQTPHDVATLHSALALRMVRSHTS